MLLVLEIWQLDAGWQNESQAPCPADGGLKEGSQSSGCRVFDEEANAKIFRY